MTTLLVLDGDGLLHRQVYRALRAAILDGTLTPGARLPSTRALTRDLGLSRTPGVRVPSRMAARSAR